VELIYSALVSMASFALERTTHKSIQAELHAASSRTYRQAADCLLSSMCDAVVEVTDTLDIVSDFSRLSALLLHLRPAGWHRATNFCDFVYADADKEMLKYFIQQSALPPRASIADTIHISLKDSNLGEVPVQLFLTSCQALCDTEVVHIIGIREEGGAFISNPSPEQACAATAASPRLSAFSPCEAAAISRGSTSQRSSIRSTSVRSLSPCSTSCSSLHIPLADAAAMTVWLCADDERYRILQWTPTFIDFLGASAAADATHFVDLVADRESFQRRMQIVVNSIVNSMDARESVDFALRPGPGVGANAARCQALVQLACEMMADTDTWASEEDSGGWIIQVDIKPKRVAKHRTNSSRRSSRSGAEASIAAPTAARLPLPLPHPVGAPTGETRLFAL